MSKTLEKFINVVASRKIADSVVLNIVYTPLDGYRITITNGTKEVVTDFFDNPLSIIKHYSKTENLNELLIAKIMGELGVKDISVEQLFNIIKEVCNEAFKNHYLAHSERKKALPKPNTVILSKPLTFIKKTVIPVMINGVLRYIDIDDYRTGVMIKALISNRRFLGVKGGEEKLKEFLKEHGIDENEAFIVLNPYEEIVFGVYVDDKGEIALGDFTVRQGYNEVFEEYLTNDEIEELFNLLDMKGKVMLLRYAKKFFKKPSIDNLPEYFGIDRIPIKRVSTTPPKRYIDMILKDIDEVIDVLFNKEVFDERLLMFYEGYAFESYYIAYSPHGFIITPSGTGKTLFADALGIRIDDTTAPGLFGTTVASESGESKVIKGKLQGQRCLIQIEQLEYKKYSQPLQGILNAMRTGKVVRELAHGEVIAYTTSPIVFTNNPVIEKIALMVGELGKIAGNVQALGGRLQTFLFTTSMQPANKFIKDDLWEWAVTSLKYIRSYRDFVRRWRRILNTHEVSKFLQDSTLDTEIRALYSKVPKPANPEIQDIYDFIKSYSLTKKWGLHYHALVRSGIRHIKEIVQGNINPKDLVNEAIKYHEEMIKLILQSIYEFLNTVKVIGFKDYIMSSSKLTIAIVTAILQWANENNLIQTYGEYTVTVDELRKYMKDSSYGRLSTKALEEKIRIAFIEGGTPTPLLNAGISFKESPEGKIVVVVDMSRLRSVVSEW